MNPSLNPTRPQHATAPHATARAALGFVLACLLPGRAEILRKGFTLPSFADGFRGDWIDRMIRHHLAYRAGRDSGALEALHQYFWQQQRPGDWFRDSERRHVTHQAPALEDVARRIHPLLQARGIAEVCEFGPGAGLWLDHLSRSWSGIDRFVGVDIAQGQVDLNAIRFPHLEFICADLLEWACSSARPNCIFVTHCGVFEYLSQSSLEQLYATLVARAPGSMLFIAEPFGRDYDLATETDSRPYGYEFSFSHNHPHLCRRAGMKLDLLEEREIRDDRQQVLVAHWP